MASGVRVGVEDSVSEGVEDGVSDIRPEADGVDVEVAVGVGVEGSVSEGVEDGVSEIRPEADGVDVDVSLGVGDLVTDRVSTGVHDGLQVPVVLVDADIDLVGLAVQVRVDADERDFDGVSVCVGVERRV